MLEHRPSRDELEQENQFPKVCVKRVIMKYSQDSSADGHNYFRAETTPKPALQATVTDKNGEQGRTDYVADSSNAEDYLLPRNDLEHTPKSDSYVNVADIHQFVELNVQHGASENLETSDGNSQFLMRMSNSCTSDILVTELILVLVFR